MTTIHGTGGRTRGRGTPIGKSVQPPAEKRSMTIRVLAAEEIEAMIGHYLPGKLKPSRALAQQIYQPIGIREERDEA